MAYRKRHNRWHELDSKNLLEALGKFRDSLGDYSSKALFVKPLYARLEDK